MKKIPSFIVLSLIALAVCSFSPKSVLADGMVIKPDPYSDRWDYSDESNQQAFINYDNGLQKMIISVGLEGENSNGKVDVTETETASVCSGRYSSGENGCIPVQRFVSVR